MSVETHSAVMSAMRSGNAQPQFYQQLLDEYADRAEKAHKREIDALTAELDTAKHCWKVWSDRADELLKMCNGHYAVVRQLEDLVKRLCEGLETVYEREGIDYGSGEAYDDAKKYLAELDKGENANCSQTTK